MKTHETSPATCQACGQSITGEIHRFSGVPSSAFCSIECQVSKAEITVEEVRLGPVGPRVPRPRYTGPMPRVLHYDRWCECIDLYENEITVPKGHSLICFCPRCGCVTQD
jgi:hypothetical protein